MSSRAGQSAQTGEHSVAPRRPELADPQLADRREGGVRGLQRSIGNRALVSLLQQQTQALPAPMHPAVQAALRTPGRPLDSSVRAEMESRLQEDFSTVRVHADAAAAKAANSVNAVAFTVGDDVVFNGNRYSPLQESGKRLLAHELAHVVQQRRGGPAPAGHVEAALEQSADRTAAAVLHGSAPVRVDGRSARAIARQAKDGDWTRANVQDIDFGTHQVVLIEGVPVLLIQNDPSRREVYFTIDAFKSESEKTVKFELDTNLPYQPIVSAVDVFKNRGYKITGDPPRKPPVQLGEHPYQSFDGPRYPNSDTNPLDNPLPPFPLRPAPKPPPKPARRPNAPAKKAPPPPTPKKEEQKAPDLPPLPPPAADAANPTTPQQPVIELPEMVIVGEVETKPVDAPPPPSAPDLIKAHTDTLGLNLNEEDLGADLAAKARAGQVEITSQVLDQVSWSDRDDVSVAFAEACSDEDLKALARTEKGRRLLDRLFDELTEGEVGADEQKQADRILTIKTQENITGDQFTEGIAKAKKSLTLPYKKAGLTVFTPSPIYARRLPDGKIAIHLRQDIYGTDYYRDPDIRLPKNIWDEVILNENDIVGVKFYDEGGAINYFPALYLLQLENEASRLAVHKAVEAFALGLTLGTSSLAGVAGEGAVETGAFTTLGRVAAYARTGVVVADRVATGLDIANSLIQEHRGWIIEKSPVTGKSFVNGLDQINSYAQIYGLLRGGVGLVQLTVSLRTSFQKWRASVRALDTLSQEEARNVERIENETERLLHDLDDAGKQPPSAPNAQGANASGAAPPPSGTGGPAPRQDSPAAPVSPDSTPDLRVIQGGGQRATPPRRGHLTDVSSDVQPITPPQTNLGTQLQQAENEIEQADQVPLRAASGDPATENLRPTAQRQGTSPRNSAGRSGPDPKTIKPVRSPNSGTPPQPSSPTRVGGGNQPPTGWGRTAGASPDSSTPTSKLPTVPSAPAPPKFTPIQEARFERVLDFLNDQGVDPKRLFGSPEEATEFFKGYPTTDEALTALEGRARRILNLRLGEVEAGKGVSGESKASGLDPFATPPTGAEIRLTEPGIASGGRDLPPKIGRLFSPTKGRVSQVPGQIAARMRGMRFNNWRSFRETFWKTLSRDAGISGEFSAVNQARMQNGLAPFVEGGQSVGGGANAVLQLNHIEPIEQGGSLYDFDNIEIVTPFAHQTLGTYE